LELHPIYPAMVMGTGSLSSAAFLLGMRALSAVLFVVAAVAFAVLCALAAVRVARHGELVRTDAWDPRKAFAPYTFVAALAVLATRAVLGGHTAGAAVALVVGVAGLIALAVPALGMVRSQAGRPGAVTGNWQLPSVAVEALALLAVTAGSSLRSEGYEAVGVGLWLAGIPAYLVVIPAIVRRFGQVPFGPEDLTPDYWTLLAVPSLIGLVAARLWATPGLAAASWLRGGYEAVAFGGLAVSAALAPAWTGLQAWRLLRDPSSRRYAPAWWGLVFPTAIVVVAAEVVGETFGARWLHPAALVGFWCVFAVWAVLVTGLVRDLFRRDTTRRAAA